MIATDYYLCHGKKIKPCPWCGMEAQIYTNGSYVRGWLSFVECSSLNECGARGPNKRTGGMSDHEYENENETIDAWNSIVGGK